MVSPMIIYPSRLLKTPSESFDGLRTSGERIEVMKKIPSMLRLSKHSVSL
jgi:hypothetical protein